MKTLVYLLAISMLCCVGQNLSQQPNFRLAESKTASLEKLETETKKGTSLDDLTVESQRPVLGASLENRYVLTTYVEGGFSIYDLEDCSYSEYSLSGESPYSEWKDACDLLYLGPGGYLFRRSAEEPFLDKNGKSTTVETILEWDAKQKAEEEFVKAKREKLSINVDEEDEDLIETQATWNNYYPTADYNEFKVIYNYTFFKKYTNYSINDEGNCGIVAIELLMSYMDAIYDSDIMDDKYTSYLAQNLTNAFPPESINAFPQTPGTLQDFSTDLTEYCVEKGYCDPDTYGMTLKEIRSAFNAYMKDIRGFTSSDYSVTSVEGNLADIMTSACKKRIKQQVLLGNPLIVGLGDPYRHAVICYGYSDDMFLMNMGDRAYTDYAINQKYAETCVGFAEWKRARLNIPNRYLYEGVVCDPIVRLRATPNIATHASFQNLFN